LIVSFRFATLQVEMKARLGILLLFVANLGFPLTAVASGFVEPWKNPTTALVIDPFYGNWIDWDKMKGEGRLVGIIHKATIGTTAVDPKYRQRKLEAKKRGYLWGSYHWGISGNPEQQADFYIDTVQPADDEVMALDLEDVTSNKFMSVEEATKFIARVKVRTGRYPMIYAAHKSVTTISRSPLSAAFANTPLWYARFLPEIKDLPNNPWSNYTLWQFSSEIRVQYRIPGTLSDIDISVFNGSIDALRSAWPFTFSRDLIE
jgi:lysozyme